MKRDAWIVVFFLQSTKEKDYFHSGFSLHFCPIVARYSFKYCNSSLSWLVADFQDAYEGEIWCLCTVTFGQNWIVDRSTAHDFMVLNSWMDGRIENDYACYSAQTAHKPDLTEENRS